MGTSLSIPATGFQYHLFGRDAKIVVIDIDPHEHMKGTVRIDKFIQDDLRHFFSNEWFDYNQNCDWVNKCQEWKNKWPVFSEQPNLNNDKSGINLYKFSEVLQKNLVLRVRLTRLNYLLLKHLQNKS